MSAVFWAVLLPAQNRPPITGIAHVALKTDDPAAARQFYGHDLGFEQVLKKDDPGSIFFQVNPDQFIQLSPDLHGDAEDRLVHIAFKTPDAGALRIYLEKRGIRSSRLDRNPDRSLSFSVVDPEGHQIVFVQTPPAPAAIGPDSRISRQIIHAGFMVRDRAVEDRFFVDVLGFDEMWQGGKTDAVADWVDMRVPDGNDWLEYMLNVRNPTPKTRGVMNHLALGVPSVNAAYQTLLDRRANVQDQKPKIGRDGKWQLNLYDPNLTRVELMEPKPVETPCCSPMKPPRETP
jgi:catechol 2,3-dioxygenase-like lactoylglutathione lyase family enzyme